MADIARPAFIEEEAWNAASDGQKLDWASYARALSDLSERPDFRAVAVRWIDELCGVFDAMAVTMGPIDPIALAMREGRRQPGVQLMQHLQAVAPKMWMRGLQEAKNARVRVEMGPPERSET